MVSPPIEKANSLDRRCHKVDSVVAQGAQVASVAAARAELVAARVVAVAKVELAAAEAGPRSKESCL